LYSTLARFLSLVWALKQERSKLWALWRGHWSVQISMIFVRIQERFARTGAVRMVFALVEYAPVFLIDLALTVRLQHVQWEIIIIPWLRLALQAVLLGLIKMCILILAWPVRLRVISVSILQRIAWAVFPLVPSHFFTADNATVHVQILHILLVVHACPVTIALTAGPVRWAQLIAPHVQIISIGVMALAWLVARIKQT
jgi:hypothetical protein